VIDLSRLRNLLVDVSQRFFHLVYQNQTQVAAAQPVHGVVYGYKLAMNFHAFFGAVRAV
jgi:hypothetical protein